MLKREDFRNDKVDAGEIGAGHTVTALYEIWAPNGSRRCATRPRDTGQTLHPRCCPTDTSARRSWQVLRGGRYTGAFSMTT